MGAMMGEWRWSLVVMVVVVSSVLQAGLVLEVEAAGTWRVVTPNAGITSMHTAVAPVTGNVVMLHQTNNGASNMTFPDGRCKNFTYDRFLPVDCYVHSVIMDPNNGTVRPLFIQTDTQCSSGQFMKDGTLGQTGGDREGTAIRRTLAFNCLYVYPTDKICDWVESPQKLASSRWYATNQLLPDGRQIVVGGRTAPSYEFDPPYSLPPQKYFMPFLNETSFDGPDVTSNGPNNIYPYVYLMPSSGYLYIFANRDSILLDYKTNVVIRSFPKIPGNPRNYPSGGSSVMLPLTWQNGFKNKVEVLVCGGAMVTSTNESSSVPLPYCSVTCGRMEITKVDTNWTMENMAIPRCMGDMVLTPDLNVLIINGAQRGWQGWGNSAEPALIPLLYEPKKAIGQRFTSLDAPATGTPRLYHSTANLLPDASVMVAGSNNNEFYQFQRASKWWPPQGRFFPTELSVEAFTPPYAGLTDRPVIMSSNGTTVKFNSVLQVVFWDKISQNDTSQNGTAQNTTSTDTFLFTVNPPAFSTHSFSHGQRMVSLQALSMTTTNGTQNEVPVNIRTVNLQIPVFTTVLPGAYYMLWVVKNGNPSVSCLWIRTK